MEELLQELHATLALGYLLADLGWYGALADQWDYTIKPLFLQVWECLQEC